MGSVKTIEHKAEGKNQGGKDVVKSNRLITAIENLTLSETRLIQLAIINARESKMSLSSNERLIVSLESFAETFKTTEKNAYMIMKEADKSLMNKTFYFLEDGEVGRSNWVQESIYKNENKALEILLTARVVKEITNINGSENFFTSYRLAQTSDFSSIYSLRLFELLMRWSSAKKTPIFDLNAFKEQMGLKQDEYAKMSNFKARVLDIAVSEINENTEIDVEYKQHTQIGSRKIVGISFSIKNKNIKYKREEISIEEALKLSQTVVAGSYAGETEEDAILRVMKHKDAKNKSVYLVRSTPESWAEYRAAQADKAKKRDKKALEHKNIAVGNTVIDDNYIDKHIQKGETRAQAKDRLIAQLQRQLALDLENDDMPDHVRAMQERLEKEKKEREENS